MIDQVMELTRGLLFASTFAVVMFVFCLVTNIMRGKL